MYLYIKDNHAFSGYHHERKHSSADHHSLKIILLVVFVSHDLFWDTAPTSPLFMVNKSPDPPFQTTASKLPISSPAELKVNM